MKPNNNNNRKRNSYFSTNIQQKGENFLEQKNAQQLQNDAIRIFRDLARGNVDLEKYGEYFLDPMMIDACIIAATNKVMYHTISYNGVNYMINYLNSMMQAVDPNIIMVSEDHRKSMEVYTIILQNMQCIAQTKDLNYLPALINNISRFRQNI